MESAVSPASDDEGHLLESVSSLSSVAVAEHECTVVLDREQLGLKRPVFVAVGVEASAAVEPTVIFAIQMVIGRIGILL
jgi:hypothetical protein